VTLRRLIADLAWRGRWRWAFFALTVAAMYAPMIVIGNPSRAFAASMGAAFGVGPMLTLWHVPRSIWFLPVARRDVWRAGWIVAVPGVTMLTTLVKLALLLVPQVRDGIGLAGIMLSSACDLAYLGVGCGLVILANWPQPASGWRRGLWTVFRGLANILLPLGMSALYVAMAVDNAFPATWRDLGPRGIAVLIAGLALTAATYFHSPSPVTPSNRLAPRPRTKTSAARLARGGLSALPRLLVHEAMWTLVAGGSLVAAALLLVVVGERILHAPEAVGGVMRTILLQIDGRGPAPRGDAEVFVFLIGFGVFVASVIARFPIMIRHLRVLPLGSVWLNALLVLWPAAVWLAAWLAWMALHYAVIGDGVVSYHTGALLALIGVSAMVQSVTIRLSSVARIFGFACLIGIVPLMPIFWTPKPTVFAAAGTGLIVAAAFFNRRALARGSTYRMVGPMIGTPRTPR
jgi:hypothetical protein